MVHDKNLAERYTKDWQEHDRHSEGYGGRGRQRLSTEVIERNMLKVTEIQKKSCSFSWEKLRELKESGIEFWAADGFTRLRILEADEKDRKIYMITHTGEKTWPLRFQKLEEVHNKLHNGEITPIPYEIDKYVPMWGGYITGLLRYLGCLDT